MASGAVAVSPGLGGWVGGKGRSVLPQSWVLFMQLNPDPQWPILSTAAEDLGPMAWGATQGEGPVALVQEPKV